MGAGWRSPDGRRLKDAPEPADRRTDLPEVAERECPYRASERSVTDRQCRELAGTQIGARELRSGPSEPALRPGDAPDEVNGALLSLAVDRSPSAAVAKAHLDAE